MERLRSRSWQHCRVNSGNLSLKKKVKFLSSDQTCAAISQFCCLQGLGLSVECLKIAFEHFCTLLSGDVKSLEEKQSKRFALLFKGRVSLIKHSKHDMKRRRSQCLGSASFSIPELLGLASRCLALSQPFSLSSLDKISTWMKSSWFQNCTLRTDGNSGRGDGFTFKGYMSLSYTRHNNRGSSLHLLNQSAALRAFWTATFSVCSTRNHQGQLSAI